ncbi:hypothetical protein HOP50_04g31040 [Chloropicon primus]|uniref:Uncharacterized protein n=1 Tax=Chloropicon primus TaxID=1764295 RepID=A0A5B8MKJ5_9CHLO|nr:hypothetical protein A3770_04p31020 [Chloropicon primus]UPQ99795.1 hypothetical protein HOP50_04g31040 [Chloropicon primus]|eukprot:QDZ20584.1 hypothetical protein A3770_04p31020 [Chloropicon primus]
MLVAAGARGFAKKVKGGKGKGAAAGGLKGIQPDLQPWLPLILKPKREKVKHNFTEEELQDAERRAKEYSRQKSYQNLAWRRDMEAKFQLRNEAWAALPEALQHSANQPDLEPFPLTRRIPTDYPPATWPL